MTDKWQKYIDYPVSDSPIMLEDIKILTGANYFSGGPIIRFRINLGAYDEVFSNQIPGLRQKLEEYIPSLIEHKCSVGEVGGFLLRVEEGTLLGHIMEHVVIELQTMAGMHTAYGKTRTSKVQGVYNVVFRYMDEVAGIYAGKAGLNLVNSIVNNEPFDVATVVDNLVKIREARFFGPSTQAIVDEAFDRFIPIIRLDKYNQVQLGTGKYRRIIRATVTHDTSMLAINTTDDKFLTNKILEEAGIPVPRTITTDSLDEVLAFFHTINRPIVIKPTSGYQGRCVSIGLNDEEKIKNAFEYAQTFEDDVMVQEDILGGTYRLLVINFKFVAAVRMMPPTIVGDGVSTVAQLIEKLNAQPERRVGNIGKLSKVEIDDDTQMILQLENLTLDTVMVPERVVYLKNTGSMRLGGSSVDFTDKVHPLNRYIAERVAKFINLNVAGIDVLSENIRQPLTQNNGKVIDVNAAPDFRVHIHPTMGEPRLVQRQFIDMLFPPDKPTHIPLFSITGSHGKYTTAYILDAVLRKHGNANAWISRRGLFLNGFTMKQGDASDAENVQIALKDPTIDTAVVETPVEVVLSSGLGYDLADFGIFLNVLDEKMDIYTNYDHMRDIRDVIYAKSVVVEQVYPTGYAIINADYDDLHEVARRCKNNVVLFTTQADNKLVQKHITKGGIGATYNDGEITIMKGTEELFFGNIRRIPLLFSKNETYMHQSLTAAVIALRLFGLPEGRIIGALDQLRLPKTSQSGEITTAQID